MSMPPTKVFTRRFIKDLLLIGIFSACFYILTHNPVSHPQVPNSIGVWSIQLMQQPILLGIAGHNYLVLRDQNNTIQKELHGLATNARSGSWKYIGTDATDQLKVWEFDTPELYVTQKGYAGTMLYEGNKEDALLIWNMGLLCKERINALNLSYPPYGVNIRGDTENSNSVSYTLTLCMGLNTSHLGLITPGWGKNLLDSK